MEYTSPTQYNGYTQQGSGYPPQPASLSQATANPIPSIWFTPLLDYSKFDDILNLNDTLLTVMSL